MKKSCNIWIIDTSVFLNILNVPKFNQDRDEVLQDFKKRIENNDKFFLPYGVLVETGNHIAQLSGNNRYSFAEKFVNEVKKALNDESPYKPLKFPTKDELLSWIDDFPIKADEGKGFGDFSIIKDWEQQKNRFLGCSVKIWSLDNHLMGYSS